MPNQYQNQYQNHPTNPPIKKKSNVNLVLLIVGIFLAVCILLFIISVRIFDRMFYGVTDAWKVRQRLIISIITSFIGLKPKHIKK